MQTRKVSAHGRPAATVNIHLHIERLVLDGLPLAAWQGPQLQAALERELIRLLADGGLPSILHSGASVPTLHAGTITLAPRGAPTSMGEQIAGAIHRSLGGAP